MAALGQQPNPTLGWLVVDEFRTWSMASMCVLSVSYLFYVQILDVPLDPYLSPFVSATKFLAALAATI